MSKEMRPEQTNLDDEVLEPGVLVGGSVVLDEREVDALVELREKAGQSCEGGGDGRRGAYLVELELPGVVVGRVVLLELAGIELELAELQRMIRKQVSSRTRRKVV